MVENSNNLSGGLEKYIILSFSLSRGITNLPNLVIGLLLIDVGRSFNQPVGIAGQLNTVSSLLGIIFAIIMGVISVRYNHKSLLAFGLLVYIISAIACFSANSFSLMLILYSLNGISGAMVVPMINSMIGELLPVDRRTSVIGYTIAGLALVYLIGTLSTNYLYSLSGWRITLLLVVVPVTILTLVMIVAKVPSPSTNINLTQPLRGYLEGYKFIISNRSALACLVGTSLGFATWNLYLVYASSFFRQVFGASISFVVFTNIFFCLIYLVGSLLAGRFVMKLGKKKLTALTLGSLGVLTLAFSSTPSIWLSLGIAFASCFLAGMMITVSISLTLEQVPDWRGTMMSIHSASTSMGGMLAASLGGLILIAFNYSVLGIVMGVIGIVGSLSFYLYSVDPTKP